jgi:hypothetical protein
MSEWYRSVTWDAEAFEARLRRARPASRPQYLCIQGLTLVETGDPARIAIGVQLLRRLYEDKSEDARFEWSTAPEYLADAYVAAGEVDVAPSLYVEACERQQRSNFRGLPEFKLGALVLDHRLDAHYRTALDLLVESGRQGSWYLDWHKFEQARLVAQLAERLKDKETARAAAREALDLARTRTAPEFPRHRDVGLIATDEVTLDALRTIAAA